MSSNTIDTQETAHGPQSKRKPPAKKAKPTKKSQRPKKAAGKPKVDRANKKAGVTALIKRAKGATLAEIMAATGWQAHTVRGLISLLGSEGGEKIESSKNEAGSAPTGSRNSWHVRFQHAAPGFLPEAAFSL